MKLITISILILLFGIIKINGQTNDQLILNGDTLYLYASPLEQVDSISQRIFKKIEEKYSSSIISEDCWRGFSADWIVIDNNLYLTNVRQCETGRNINKIIEQILNKKFHNGLIRADWIQGEFWCGKDLARIPMFNTSIFCHEFLLNISYGSITDIKKKNYIPCEYYDKNTLTEFILTRLDWSKLPDLKNKLVETSVYVQNNKTGKIIDAKIENSSDSAFNEEFLRVIWLLPCMPVYFHEGIFYDVGQDIDIRINEDIKSKYVR